MRIALTLKTTFHYFAEFLDSKLSELFFLYSSTEDGYLFFIEHKWKGELSHILDITESDVVKRRELFARFTYGKVGVRVRYSQNQPLHDATHMPTMSFEIATQQSNVILVKIDEHFDELPDFCPTEVKDRLSGLLCGIAEVWPESQPQIRRVLPKLRSAVSSQEWERWQEGPSAADESISTDNQETVTKPSPDAPLPEWIEFFNPTGRPGRRSSSDDIWAAVEVLEKHTPKKEVYEQWKRRNEARYRYLVNPDDSFKKVLKRLGTKLGQNE